MRGGPGRRAGARGPPLHAAATAALPLTAVSPPLHARPLLHSLAVVSTPADVVKTRLMGQDPSAPAYRGMAHCFGATLRAEGLRGLYSGFWPTWARLGPWQLTFWVTYEELRRAAGLSGF